MSVATPCTVQIFGARAVSFCNPREPIPVAELWPDGKRFGMFP